MSVVAIHPTNPKILTFRASPLVLVCATEHYGAVINRPFEFERYLTDAAEKKQTLSRLFLLFRELQSAMNPASSCKPESTNYISPFPSSGPGNALDGLPRYDLDGRNPEFYDRLHRFLNRASDHGIIVEVVLFSNTYSEDVWALNPFHSANNIQDLSPIPWHDYTTKRDAARFARQIAFVRSIVEELNRYENIIYEVCNEPGGDFPNDANPPSADEINEWITSLIAEIRETESKLPHRHLIAGQEAFKYKLPEELINPKDVHQFSEKAFHEMDFDIVNMHPLSNMWHRGENYDLGRFMCGSLKLRQLRDYCLSVYAEAKPLNLDEDNAASRFMDPSGWIIHRKRAWTTLMCGAHYDMIDFSINHHLETGTSESQQHIRKWMKLLSEFIHELDLATARPMLDGILQVPCDVCPSALFVRQKDWFIYLADEREGNEAGGLITGELLLDLAEGSYALSYLDPADGSWTGGGVVQGRNATNIPLPEFRDDLLVRLECASSDDAMKSNQK